MKFADILLTLKYILLFVTDAPLVLADILLALKDILLAATECVLAARDQMKIPANDWGM